MLQGLHVIMYQRLCKLSVDIEIQLQESLCQIIFQMQGIQKFIHATLYLANRHFIVRPVIPIQSLLRLINIEQNHFIKNRDQLRLIRLRNPKCILLFQFLGHYDTSPIINNLQHTTHPQRIYLCKFSGR